MKVWDTFLFADELDMLQCRLEELDASPVYRHVLVEAGVDHRGDPKPLYYAENRERFAPWADRIVHVIAAGMPGPGEGPGPWARENAQRGNIWRGLDGAGPDDYVILADVDEIPSPSALALRPDGMVAFIMRVSMFAVDWVCPEPARISVAGRLRDLGDLALQRGDGPRGTFTPVPDAGWHFTWLGGPDAIRRKARRHCHVELNEMILAGNDAGEWYEQGWTFHGAGRHRPGRRECRMAGVDVDGTWPRYIRERRCPGSWFRPCGT